MDESNPRPWPGSSPSPARLVARELEARAASVAGACAEVERSCRQPELAVALDRYLRRTIGELVGVSAAVALLEGAGR